MLKKLWNYTKRILTNERGAFSLVKFLGLGKKSPDIPPTKTTLPPASLTGFPTGQALNEAILAGLRGEGVGFGEQFVSRTTSPLVAERKAFLREEELPLISGELSARGLGRSSIAGQEIGRAGTRAGRDINTIIAQAVLLNEQQKKADIARLRGEAFGFAGAEAGLATTRAGEETRRFETERGLGIGAEQARKLSDEATLNKIIATTAALLSGDPTKNIMDIFGGGTQEKTSDISSLLNFLKRGEKTSPFTGGGGGNIASVATTAFA